jgi:HPt (histidine-containing phosphotransfer) domain-containing protein
MTGARDELEKLLAAARADFASRLDDKVRELHDLASRGAWAEARRAAHKLRGSAATYGFPKVGAAAATMEEILIDASTPPTDEAQTRFASALAEARIESERARGVGSP